MFLFKNETVEALQKSNKILTQFGGVLKVTSKKLENAENQMDNIISLTERVKDTDNIEEKKQQIRENTLNLFKGQSRIESITNNIDIIQNTVQMPQKSKLNSKLNQTFGRRRSKSLSNSNSQDSNKSSQDDNENLESQKDLIPYQGYVKSTRGDSSNSIFLDISNQNKENQVQTFTETEESEITFQEIPIKKDGLTLEIFQNNPGKRLSTLQQIQSNMQDLSCEKKRIAIANNIQNGIKELMQLTDIAKKVKQNQGSNQNIRKSSIEEQQQTQTQNNIVNTEDDEFNKFGLSIEKVLKYAQILILDRINQKKTQIKQTQYQLLGQEQQQDIEKYVNTDVQEDLDSDSVIEIRNEAIQIQKDIVNGVLDAGKQRMQEAWQQKQKELDPKTRERAKKIRIIQIISFIIPTIVVWTTTYTSITRITKFIIQIDEEMDKIGDYAYVDQYEDELRQLFKDAVKNRLYNLFLFISLTIFTFYTYSFGCFRSVKKNKSKLQKLIEAQEKIQKEKFADTLVNATYDTKQKTQKEINKKLKLLRQKTKEEKANIEYDQTHIIPKKYNRCFFLTFAICFVCVIFGFLGQWLTSLFLVTTNYGLDGELSYLVNYKQNHIFEDVYDVCILTCWAPVYIIPIQTTLVLLIGRKVYAGYQKASKYSL